MAEKPDFTLEDILEEERVRREGAGEEPVVPHPPENVPPLSRSQSPSRRKNPSQKKPPRRSFPPWSRSLHPSPPPPRRRKRSGACSAGAKSGRTTMNPRTTCTTASS